ncbi:conserved hypothetical protein [Candidatus Terasakiella magnetica]|nr:conserved hypothetical protein [Candidatus Terasakiella magnetica]
MGIFFDKHAPKTFDDLVFPDTEMAARFEAYVKGQSFGHILMHGPHGCGKTTIARMLPHAIAPGHDPNDNYFMYAARDASVARIRELSESFMCGTAWNASGRLFLTLDEADTMSAETRTVMRGGLDQNAKSLMVIMTSNDLSKIDLGIRDRCDVFDFSGGNFTTYLPLALRVLRKEGLHVPQDELDDLVKLHCSSIRQLLRALERVVLGIRKKRWQIAA